MAPPVWTHAHPLMKHINPQLLQLEKEILPAVINQQIPEAKQKLTEVITRYISQEDIDNWYTMWAEERQIDTALMEDLIHIQKEDLIFQGSGHEPLVQRWAIGLLHLRGCVFHLAKLTCQGLQFVLEALHSRFEPHDQDGQEHSLLSWQRLGMAEALAIFPALQGQLAAYFSLDIDPSIQRLRSLAAHDTTGDWTVVINYLQKQMERFHHALQKHLTLHKEHLQQLSTALDNPNEEWIGVSLADIEKRYASLLVMEPDLTRRRQLCIDLRRGGAREARYIRHEYTCQDGGILRCETCMHLRLRHYDSHSLQLFLKALDTPVIEPSKHSNLPPVQPTQRSDAHVSTTF